MRQLLALLVIAITVFFCCAALADFDDGVDAYDRGDYKTALREFKPLAEEGNVAAQYNLGLMYDKGDGVPQDYKEAIKWYTLAAEQGDLSSQHNLGIIYVKGKGVSQDYREAAKWYRLAAEQGHARAQLNLGVAYYNGEGVPQDYILAHMWYNLAASNGNEKAAEYRNDTARKLTPEQMIEAQKLARECVAKDYKGC